MELECIAVGIDLGTTNCVVAHYDDATNVTKIIQDASGSCLTPSVVGFTDGDTKVGKEAKEQMAGNATNTVYDSKRLIGRNFDDESVQKDLKDWPFKVTESKTGATKGKAMVEVKEKGQVKQLKPEEISAVLLKKMKTIAEDHFKQPVAQAVITVPARFDHAQRMATREAAVLAGFELLAIVNEPTAAAIAYGLDNLSAQERNVLVFDFGGGTLDVTVLSIRKQTEFEIKTTQGDMHLGGVDFDSCIVGCLQLDFLDKYLLDLTTDDRAKRRLADASEHAKSILSGAQEWEITIDGLSKQKVDYVYKLSREKFEDLAKDLFARILEPVRKALEEINFTADQIDEVVLVGGSSRIPKVQTMLAGFFGKEKLRRDINPEEAVAQGAAIRAAKLNSAECARKGLINLTLLEATSYSLGVEINDDDMHVLVPKNKRLPYTAKALLTNQIANQTASKIPVYEGEDKKTAKNNLLGEFILSDIPPLPKHTAVIEVTMEVDSSNIVTIKAVETSTGKVSILQVTRTS